MTTPNPARFRRFAEHSAFQHFSFCRIPLFPASGPATGFFNGLHAKSKFLAVILTVICGLFVVGDLGAEVRVPALFGDHVVLQRNLPLPVWGWADAGEEVEVVLGGESGKAVADAEGRWQVVLAAQPVSREPMTLTIRGTNTLVFEDVLLGDVWICSGQSNMDWGLHGADAATDIAAADYPLIRHFRAAYNFADVPAEDVEGKWSVCNPANAPGFSAVGFYFARRVHEETGVPIGLLTNAVGGTNIELWMREETLLGTPGLEGFAQQMRSSMEEYERRLKESLEPAGRWVEEGRAAVLAGEPVPPPPLLPDYPYGERSHKPRCVTLHNGMVAPLVPMALRGVLWYQGENNAGDLLYDVKKRAMIEDWRGFFNRPDMPFYFVQLANYQQASEDPGHSHPWAVIRDVQRRCLEIPHTGMAVAIDIGDANDIHPRNKFDVGERLALWALANDYKVENLVVSGPLFKGVQIEGGKVRVRFDYSESGLMAGEKNGREPVVKQAGVPLRRFAIAGSDRKWHWAQAVIQGGEVVCSHPAVPEPVAVRYAWSTNPEGANLYNCAGLPASPFRSDDW